VPNIANWDGNNIAYWYNTGTMNGAVSANFNVSVEVVELDASVLHFFADTGLQLDINIRDDNGSIVRTCKAIAVADFTTVDLSPYEYVFKFDKWPNVFSVHQFRINMPFSVIFQSNALTMGTQFSLDIAASWVKPAIIRPFPLYCDDAGKVDFKTNNFFFIQSSQPMVITYSDQIRSGARYQLSDLWDFTKKPWDIILNYMKIFRMMVLVEEDVQHNDDGTITDEKVIRFVSAKKFFSQYTIEDWTDKLDMGKDFVVKPVYWQSNKVLFNTDDNETALGKRYKEKYGVNFGEKRIITDYKFDTKETKLFDTPIKNTIITTDNVLSWKTTYDIGAISYSRSTSEVFANFADEDGKLLNPFGSFAFAMGNSAWDTGGNLRNVILSDDTINQQSQGKYYYSQTADPACCLASNGYQKVDIAKWRSMMTFATPMENYSLTSYTTDGLMDIYSAFWQNYINERYNVQSKMVTCYLYIKPIDYMQFKYNKFIRIENQVYFVNKIIDYDVMSDAPTKCELITVRDISAYYTDRFVYIDMRPNNFTVLAGRSFTVDVETNGNGTWAIESPGVFDPIPPSGTGPGTVTVNVANDAPPGDYQMTVYRTDSPFPSFQDKEHCTITITVTTPNGDDENE